MYAFNYRAYDMELDFCEQEHGFWLDDGEEQRVLELMKQRIKDLGRASKAEAQWADLLQSFKSKTLGKRIKGLFRR
jgi:Zn-finger nucleic acid-binding protein